MRKQRLPRYQVMELGLQTPSLWTWCPGSSTKNLIVVYPLHVWILFCTCFDQVIKDEGVKWVLNQHRQSSSIIPSQDPAHYDLNWICKQFFQGSGSNGLWYFGKIPPPDSVSWLFWLGPSNEKPHNLFNGYPPEKTSSRPWLEIARWAKSYFKYNECVISQVFGV